MPALRNGDEVVFRAVVTAVAPHGTGQQIQAKILPNGETIGWCIPTENAFKVLEHKLKVGDKVQRKPEPRIYFELVMIDKNSGQSVLRNDAGRLQTCYTKDLERVD